MIISKNVPLNALALFRGPCGAMLNINDLPADQGRWTARKKAIVVYAIKQGALTFTAARERYNMAESELTTWMEAKGIPELRSKNLNGNRLS